MRRVFLLFVVLVLGAPLQGCAPLLGRRYTNFRAYYNTFYNARDKLREGERGVQEAQRQVDRTHLVTVFPAAGAAATAQRTPMETAVEKGAELLRRFPESKWADDALLLMGKAYFYLGNSVGAEGKFREAIAAAEAREQEELAAEARFWLARTLGAAERYDEAVAVLEEGLAREDASRYWAPRLQLARGEILAHARRYGEAAPALEAGLADLRDDDLAARAAYLLGQVYEAAEQPAQAADAYARVLRHQPRYELEYAALLDRALVLGLRTDRKEEALTLLRQMRRDDRHAASRAEVELAYARVLAAAGQPDEADARFRELLYSQDPRARASANRGEVYLRYGEFFRDARADLRRAAVYFDTASAQVRTEPAREERVTAAALTGVRRQADVYRAYATLAGRIAELDSLLYLGSLDEPAFQAAIVEIEARRLREWEEEQRRLERLRASQGFEGGPILRETYEEGERGRDPASGGEDGAPLPPGGPGTPSPGIEVGFLNYRNITLVQENLLAFEQVWGTRPLVPNWRRRAAIGTDAANRPGTDLTIPAFRNDEERGGPPPLDLGAVPRSPLAQARLRTERAALRYELGNVLFLSMARPDLAVEWYRLVVEEDAEASVAPRALYALAEAERALGRADDAAPLYEQVLAADSTSELARQARERLGLPPLVATEATTEALADAAYDDAYGQWQSGDYAAALAALLDVGDAYPGTEAGARALLAAGLVFSEWAHRDSLDLFGPLPRVRVDSTVATDSTVLVDTVFVSGPTLGALYARVEAEYPETGYADRALTLREAYEAARPTDAAADSSNAAETDKPDEPLAGDLELGEAEGVAPPLPDFDVPVAPDAPAEAWGLQGDQPINTRWGGVAWRVASVPSPLAAQSLARGLRRRGYRTAITTDEGPEGSLFILLVGQFASIADGEAARSELPPAGVGRDLRLVPISGMILLDEAALGDEGINSNE